jgi:hypothetical protein
MAYNGTRLGQDSRFKNPDKDILSSMKTPKSYKTTVSKHNLIIYPIIKLWLNKKISDILEFEDETLINLIINLIKSSDEKIDPKNIQYQISGFLGDNTYSFMKQFWKLLINIQELHLKDKTLIPEELIPFKEEYEKRKQYFQNNKRKFENNNNDIKIKNNYNEIIDINDKNRDEYRINKRNISRSRSRSRSRRYKRRSRSSSRSTNKNRSLSRRMRNGRYKNRSRSRTRSNRRSNWSMNRSRERSKNRSRSSRYRDDRNNLDYRKDSNDKDEIKYKYGRIKEIKRDYSNENYYSRTHHSKIHKRKKLEYRNNSRSLSRSDSSETVKLERRSIEKY